MMGMSRKTVRRIHGTMFKLPLMITCEVFEDFILAYLDDELSVKQKFAFEMHLKLCRECRDYLKAYRVSLTLAKDSVSETVTLLPDEVPEDLILAILEARKA
jgi:predicted anti-sigma-YlaC factor YlaD